MNWLAFLLVLIGVPLIFGVILAALVIWAWLNAQFGESTAASIVLGLTVLVVAIVAGMTL
jgi:hypothetical protein